MRRKVLAIAASSGRVAYVCFEDDQLIDFALSRRASSSPKQATAYARKWIALLNPDVVITQKCIRRSAKRENARALIRAMAREASKHELLDISAARIQHYSNKYVEAETYSKRFPDLVRYLKPKPRIWECEPRTMSYFEAVALALPIIDAQADT